MNFTQELIKENVAKLREIIATLTFKPNWAFSLDNGNPTKFAIHIECEDSTGQHRYIKPDDDVSYELFTDRSYILEFSDKPFQVRHVFDIPTVDLTTEELERYVLDRIMDVDRHETMEFFKINGKAVFMPDHDDVFKLYSIHRRE